MTIVSSSSSLGVAVAPYTRPQALYLSHHSLRPPAASALEAASSRGEACASFGDLALTPTAFVSTTKTARPSASPLHLPPPPGLRIANALRGGGGASGRARLRRRRARRPLRRFLAPALVWIVALAYDFDLWWRRGPWEVAAAASSSSSSSSLRESNATLLRFAWGHVAGSAVAYRTHFVCFHVLLGLALLSHIAVTVANPGFFQPGNQALNGAQPPERWCGHCERHKPPRAHHCGRCGACVARMDHHCVFAANCIGAGNHKQLLLLVLYAAACAAHAVFLYSRSSPRRLPPVIVAPTIVFCWLCGLFGQQLYGIGVDAGTVDRLQSARSQQHRVAERVQPPPQAGAARLGTAVALASASPTSPDKYRGIGLGVQLRSGPNASTPARKERAEFADRPGAGTIATDNGFPVAGLPRGPGSFYFRAAVDGDVHGDGGFGAIARGASFCRALWGSLREEILGEGPWFLWLVPTPARLSSEAEARIFGWQ